MRFTFRLHKDKDLDICSMYASDVRKLGHEFETALYYFVRNQRYCIKKISTHCEEINAQYIEIKVNITDSKSIHFLNNVTRGLRSQFAKSLLRNCMDHDFLNAFISQTGTEIQKVTIDRKKSRPKQLVKQNKINNDKQISSTQQKQQESIQVIKKNENSSFKETIDDNIINETELCDSDNIEDLSAIIEETSFDVFADFENMMQNNFN